MAYGDATELVEDTGLETVDNDGIDFTAKKIAAPDTELTVQVTNGDIMMYVESTGTLATITVKAPVATVGRFTKGDVLVETLDATDEHVFKLSAADEYQDGNAYIVLSVTTGINVLATKFG